MAQEYINQGALWNSGVFAFKLEYIVKKAHELIKFTDYNDLYDKYKNLERISFDYAIVESEKEIEVQRFNGKWKDLGTWNTLTEAMKEEKIGRALLDTSCENVHVVNELNIPVLCMGLSNIVVSAAPDGILISDKEKSSYIKPHIEIKLMKKIMYAEKSWGI